mmetsp:Transcript_87759/g.253422  ORF Transcript_87759/g.253422 Transcript_87759/m.253422 type:complete len:261 (+) Transcript_87759:36-818(+)
MTWGALATLAVALHAFRCDGRSLIRRRSLVRHVPFGDDDAAVRFDAEQDVGDVEYSGGDDAEGAEEYDHELEELMRWRAAHVRRKPAVALADAADEGLSAPTETVNVVVSICVPGQPCAASNAPPMQAKPHATHKPGDKHRTKGVGSNETGGGNQTNHAKKHEGDKRRKTGHSGNETGGGNKAHAKTHEGDKHRKTGHDGNETGGGSEAHAKKHEGSAPDDKSMRNGKGGREGGKSRKRAKQRRAVVRHRGKSGKGGKGG